MTGSCADFCEKHECRVNGVHATCICAFCGAEYPNKWYRPEDGTDAQERPETPVIAWNTTFGFLVPM